MGDNVLTLTLAVGTLLAAGGTVACAVSNLPALGAESPLCAGAFALTILAGAGTSEMYQDTLDCYSDADN
jgi:hypothetical protein